MVDLSQVPHHPAIEELVDIICKRTQNTDRAFFRVPTAYFLSVMASTMRVKVKTMDRGDIPISTYAIALSPSGTGKGFSMGILENEFMHEFRSAFREVTLPVLADQNLWKLAMQRAARNGTEEAHEHEGLEKEYNGTGAYPFAFDGGSMPAVKQIRKKLLMAGAGSINLQVDEIGLNIQTAAVTEVLNGFLELYDQGRIKEKIRVSSADNKRTEEIEGKTPANMLLIGTPTLLLDGASTENTFFSLLETGYARRCLFTVGTPRPASLDKSVEEIFDDLTTAQNYGQSSKWSIHFARLADPTKHNWTVEVPRSVGIELLRYKLECEAKAKELPEHESIRATELSHRYFKALRLAGALAFVDETITMDLYHLHAAMKLVEESGEAFLKVLNREKSHERLARYMGSLGEDNEVTHADLLDALPFYPKSAGPRNDMMALATAWGYKKNIVIKKSFLDGIEIFSGETLKETSLDAIRISYSDDFAYHYQGEEVPFDQLHVLTQQPGYHWANHWFEKQHRAEENVIPGFNLVVIDVDGGTSLQTVHDLLKDYTFMTYTTKRHTPEDNRFRLIFPTTYELKLDKDDYKEFMQNIVQWLPFQTDEEANQRARKWMTNDKGKYHYNKTDRLLDVLPFIPKTSRNEEHKKEAAQLKDLGNLERWFAQRFAEGNRNNQMIRFALALADSGFSYQEIEQKVISFNKKLSNGLADDELRNTVLVSTAKKLQGQP